MILPRSGNNAAATNTKSEENDPLFQAEGSAGSTSTLLVLTLNEHLQCRHKSAEISIDLERWMRAEEIVVGASALCRRGTKQSRQQTERMIAVMKACPKLIFQAIDQPISSSSHFEHSSSQLRQV